MSLSIKHKLIILFLLTAVLPMLILGGFTYVETYKALEFTEQKRMEEQVKNITNSIDIALEDTEDLTKNLSTTPSLLTLLNSYNQQGITDRYTFQQVNESLRKIYVDAGGIYDNMLVVGRDGKILVDSWNGKYIGQNIGKEKYFQLALNEKRFVIGEVSTSNLSKTKVKLPVISMAYPVLGSDNTALGAVIITYDLNYFTRHIYKTAFGQSGFGYMFDSSGSVLYHPNIELIMKPTNIPLAQEISNGIKANMAKNYKGKGESVIKEETYLYYYQIVPKSQWIVATFIPKNQLFAVANWIRSTTLTVLLFTGIFSIIFVSLLVKNINSSLKEMKVLLKKVEQGDFTSRCTINSGDEFEDLGNAFNLMVEERNSYVRKLLNTAEKAEDVAGRVNSLVGRIKSDVDNISALTQEVSAGAETNNESIQELKMVMQQLVAEIKNIRLASGRAVEVSNNAAKSAVHGGDAVTDAVKAMHDIEKSTAESAFSVKELYQAIDSILSFVNIIKTLSAETNLIAINAAIQAANAGEHGLVFEVVANRIRGLAEASDNAAKKINIIIGDIKTREQNLLQDMTKVDEYVKTGLKKADRTENCFKQIIAEVNQNEGIIGEILSSIEEQLTSMEEVTKNMDRISQFTAKTSQDTGFIAESINHEAINLGKINENSRVLKTSSQELFDMVATIKLEKREVEYEKSI